MKAQCQIQLNFPEYAVNLPSGAFDVIQSQNYEIFIIQQSKGNF